MLEPAVLEQDARMARKRRQQFDILVSEGADATETLPDHHQPERPILAA